MDSVPLLVLDFETYFDQDFSLRKLTVPEYVHDPRFSAHGLAVRHPDGRCVFETDVPATLAALQADYGPNLEQVFVVAHNAAFDLYILHHTFGLKPAFFLDTLGLAHQVLGRKDGRMGQSASLASLAELYGLEAKGHLEFMLGVRHPDVTQQTALAEYACHDAELTYQIACRLIESMTRPEAEIPILMHTIRLFTERSLAVDLDQVRTIRQQVQARTEGLLTTAAVSAEEVSGNKTFVAALEGALSHTGRKIALKPGKKSLIPAVAKTDPEMQELVDDADPVVAALARARLGKKSQDQTLARLETLERIATATGGVLPCHLVYYGAHTGRFAGGGKFNLQNLGRGDLAGQIRGCLTAHPGHTLVIGDMAQIECRVNAHLAREIDLLSSFREQHDVYSEFASSTLGGEVRKPREGDSPELKKVLSAKRQVGKQAVLGLGFGMGALKFMNTLRKDAAAAALFDQGVLTPSVCRQIVRAFREQFVEIPHFWEDLEQAFRLAMEGQEIHVGSLVFRKVDDRVDIQLPSGRVLHYPQPRLDFTPRTIQYLDECGEEAEFVPEGSSLVYGKGVSIYGGKLAENVVQAVARDILVEAILALEQEGYPVVFHVHDEIVLHVAERQAQGARTALERVLTRPPAWASALPMAAEVMITPRYTK